mgnify:CR=1 FL=1
MGKYIYKALKLWVGFFIGVPIVMLVQGAFNAKVFFALYGLGLVLVFLTAPAFKMFDRKD